MGYGRWMYETYQTRLFQRWLEDLRDHVAIARIVARLRRMEFGYFGDVKHVGQGVREARIDHGPGYRVYYVHRGPALIVLLMGGDKRGQARDIQRAIELAKAWDRNE